MNNEGMKIVDFEANCKVCIHLDKPEEDEPCCECLTTPANQYSTKPINFEMKK